MCDSFYQEKRENGIYSLVSRFNIRIICFSSIYTWFFYKTLETSRNQSIHHEIKKGHKIVKIAITCLFLFHLEAHVKKQKRTIDKKGWDVTKSPSQKVRRFWAMLSCTVHKNHHLWKPLSAPLFTSTPSHAIRHIAVTPLLLNNDCVLPPSALTLMIWTIISELTMYLPSVKAVRLQVTLDKRLTIHLPMCIWTHTILLYWERLFGPGNAFPLCTITDSHYLWTMALPHLILEASSAVISCMICSLAKFLC